MSFCQCLVHIYFICLYPCFNLGWQVENSGVWRAGEGTFLLQRQSAVWQTWSLHGSWTQEPSYFTCPLLEFFTFKRSKSSRKFTSFFKNIGYFHLAVNLPLLIILTFTTLFCYCVSHENIFHFPSLLLFQEWYSTSVFMFIVTWSILAGSWHAQKCYNWSWLWFFKLVLLWDISCCTLWWSYSRNQLERARM